MSLFPRVISLFMASAVVTCMAQAPEWKEAFKDSEKTAYIQVGSVQRTKRGVQVWIKHEFSTPIDLKEFKTQVTVMKEKAEYSHDRKWSLRILMYDAAGRQVVDHTNPPENTGAELVPDTAEDAIAKQVWALAPKGQKKVPPRSTR